jgi:parvulin-like peptidyl-prolyl isomerase
MLRRKMASGGIVPELMMKAGDVSEMIETENGALFFVVEKRSPADMAGLPAQKDQLRQQLMQTKVSQLMQEFDKELRDQCVFTMPVGEAE